MGFVNTVTGLFDRFGGSQTPSESNYLQSKDMDKAGYGANVRSTNFSPYELINQQQISQEEMDPLKAEYGIGPFFQLGSNIQTMSPNIVAQQEIQNRYPFLSLT